MFWHGTAPHPNPNPYPYPNPYPNPNPHPYPNPNPTKGSEDGRYTEGVLRYHDHWFNTLACEAMGETLTEAILLQRGLMQKGVSIYCAQDKRRFCPRAKRRPPPPKPASYIERKPASYIERVATAIAKKEPIKVYHAPPRL